MSFREDDEIGINYEQVIDRRVNDQVNELCNIYDQTKENTYFDNNVMSEAQKMRTSMSNPLTLQTSSSEGSNQTVTVRPLIGNQSNNSGISEEKSGKDANIGQDSNIFHQIIQYGKSTEDNLIFELKQKGSRLFTVFERGHITYPEYQKEIERIERQIAEINKLRLKMLKEKCANDLQLFNIENGEKETDKSSYARYTQFLFPDYLFGLKSEDVAKVALSLETSGFADYKTPYFCLDRLGDRDHILAIVSQFENAANTPDGIFLAKVLILFRVVCEWYREGVSPLVEEGELNGEKEFDFRKDGTPLISKIVRKARGAKNEFVDVFEQATAGNCINQENSLVKNLFLLMFHFLDSYCLFFTNNTGMSEHDIIKTLPDIDKHLFENYKVVLDENNHKKTVTYKVLSKKILYMILLHYMEVNFALQHNSANKNNKSFQFLSRDSHDQLSNMYECGFVGNLNTNTYDELFKAMIRLFGITETIQQHAINENLCQDPKSGYYIISKVLSLKDTKPSRKRNADGRTSTKK